MAQKIRVCHMPQVPCESFIVYVNTIEEAELISNNLSLYDLFQFEKRIKPDYSNVTFVEMFDESQKEWVDWYDEESGMDFDEYIEALESTEEGA